MQLAVKEGTLTDVRYQAYGCPATIASASEVATRAEGTSFLVAATIPQREICAALGLASSKEASAELALEALHAALGRLASSATPLSSSCLTDDDRGVLVGMSGGVDSAVAAMLLKRAGYRVVGVTLGLWRDPQANGDRSCCSPEAVGRARRVAHALGIPHLTVNAFDDFYSNVVQYFLDEHLAGRTPNPCAKCNSRVRFNAMLSLARKLGLGRIATGHYARLVGDPPSLARAIDRGKDQSYVLGEVGPEVLRQTMFPLGGMTKREVRALAAEAELEGCAAPESQEICFVADDDHRRFLRERLGEVPGAIIDFEGRVLGRHPGVYNFTIGQRKGLGVASSEPLYVLAVDAQRRQVMVGGASDSAVGAVALDNITWHRRGLVTPTSVKLRSTGEPLPAHLDRAGSTPAVRAEGGYVTVVLDEAAQGIAPGQTAVAYDGESVVLAGTIVSTLPATSQGRENG